jgi:hypothetical protein
MSENEIYGFDRSTTEQILDTVREWQALNGDLPTDTWSDDEYYVFAEVINNWGGGNYTVQEIVYDSSVAAGDNPFKIVAGSGRGSIQCREINYITAVSEGTRVILFPCVDLDTGEGFWGFDHQSDLNFLVLNEGPGIDITNDAFEWTITSLLSGSTSILVTLGAAGAPHVVDTIKQMSITADANGLKLVNDQLAPADDSVYAKRGGAKGWFSISSMISDVVNIIGGEAIDVTEGPANTFLIDVLYQKSIDYDAVNDALELLNDELNPGNTHVYSTDNAGQKGWFGFAEQVAWTSENSDTIEFTTGPSGPDFWSADVIYQMSITADEFGLKLVNDQDAPSNYSQYRVNSGGSKGWYAPPYGFDDIWLYRDPDTYEVSHIIPEDIETGDPEYWTTIEWKDSSDTVHTAIVDKRGHLVVIDSESPTLEYQSVLYVDCYDGVKYYYNDDGNSRTFGKVYLIDFTGETGRCFVYQGPSYHAPDASQPSYIGVVAYDSCEDCQAAPTPSPTPTPTVSGPTPTPTPTVSGPTPTVYLSSEYVPCVYDRVTDRGGNEIVTVEGFHIVWR